MTPATAPTATVPTAPAPTGKAPTAAAPTAGAAPPPPRPPRPSEFTPLLRTVRSQGLLERRTGWYALGIAANLTALAAVFTAIAVVGASWWSLLLAPVLAVLWARTAFYGHDAGHSQISDDRTLNRRLGLLHADLLLGMSYGWWNDKHNRHHANPNHTEKDPDVEVGALVWTRAQAVDRRGLARFLTRHQAALFFPLLLLEGFALKVAGLRDLRRRAGRERTVEAGLLLAHLALYVTFLLLVMTPVQALAFAVLHHALFGLHLGMSFAPNHKGMDMLGPDDESLGHLRRQVLTSRNVRGGPLTDWFLGGLNYQIEHHLFPSMPRPHLRLVQPLVRAHCRRVGIPYTETALLDSYRQALSHMHAVGEPLRVEPGAVSTRS